MKKVYIILGALFIAMMIGGFFSTSTLMAQESQFRAKFVEFQRGEKLVALSSLVKQNKNTIPQEIEAIIQEAMQEGKNYNERMQLLDLASSIATMHVEWNGGPQELISKVEQLQKAEAKKKEEAEKDIVALAKLTQETENVPGNFLMTLHQGDIEKKGLKPVVYPHWVHRPFFRCKVCHEKIFLKERRANDITHEKMARGQYCGTCHNGKMSFATEDEKSCNRCHLFGLPEAKPLINMSYYTPEKFKEIASRVGSQWIPEKLPQGKLPKDKFGFINWVELDKLEAFKPKTSINGEDSDEGVRDTYVLFEMKSEFLDDVLFSHKIHSTWLNCSLCHPKIFKPEAGANTVTMIEIKEGKSCGRCHGRVSFTPKDCMRCHKHTGEPPQGTVRRTAVK